MADTPPNRVEGPIGADIDAKVEFVRRHLEAAAMDVDGENGVLLWAWLLNEHFYLFPDDDGKASL